MTKAKFNLDDKIVNLADDYANKTNKTLDSVVESALKYYLANQLGTRQLKRALKDDNSETNSITAIDQLLTNNLNNLNKY